MAEQQNRTQNPLHLSQFTFQLPFCHLPVVFGFGFGFGKAARAGSQAGRRAGGAETPFDCGKMLINRALLQFGANFNPLTND